MAAGVLELTGADFDTTISQGVVLVDFWAPWCGPCRMQGPILEEVVKTIADRAKIAKVNVDNDKDIAARFGIRGIPALLVFKDAKMVQQFTGVTRAEQLVTAIEAALK